jgi:glycosyltransferase involved in cell wall biosynthesis
VYPAGCHFAHTVIAGTQWIKDDIVTRYSINPEKVQVIPWASPTLAYSEPTTADLSAVRAKHGLEPPFALYPAAAWPHKNHIRLLEAIAHLRDERGITVRLVCTGSIADDFWLYHWPKIEQRRQQLNLGGQVKFLGFVPESEMRAIYRLAQFLVLPSLFEADSCPIHEAWSDGLPVASSNATALPDQVHDAGLLFDPKDVADIADAIARMATSKELRDKLRERGYCRMKDFDWERTAKAYRAVYRRAADRPLSVEDRMLLQWDWMRDPEKKMELAQ